MMKTILFMLPHLKISNGVARTLVNLAKQLDKRKFTIRVIVLFSYDKEMLESLLQVASVQIVFGFYFHGFAKLIDFVPDKLLYRLIVKEKCDIEVSYSFGLPTKIIAASDNRNAKHLCWMHGYDTNMEQLRYYNKYDMVICVSKENKEKLAKHLDNPHKSTYVYNIVDENEVISKSKEPITLTHKYPTFITVGRVTEAKGQYRLIEILDKRIKENEKPFYLWIIGSGSDLNKLKEEVKKRGLQDYVVFTGEQENPYKFVSKADFYICSSSSEGLSTSCIEAAILGKPIISTNVGGSQEILEIQGAGAVVEIDTESLYEEINLLLADEKIQIRWRQDAYNNANRFFKGPKIKEFENLFLN